MKNYDIVIVGASTAGSYFARRMAEKGFYVLAIDKSSREKISPEYDVFHMEKKDMEKYDLPKVKEGDGICEFIFSKQDMMSAYSNYPKAAPTEVVGMHKHDYIVLMNDWAAEAGAEIIYEAAFDSLIYDENGKINGVTYEKDGEKVTVSCRLVADCSGIPAVVRRSLPDGYGIEKFELTSDDILYVVLRYVDFTEKKGRWLQSQFWLAYKSWLAPSAGSDAILGIGACFGFDYVEKCFKQFEKNARLPGYTVKKIEKGRTPYHRAPYSFVSDGFIAMGDAACLTKPNCGEGCTASLVLEQIAVDVASKAMENGAYPTREALWSINKLYNNTQGKEFASLMALLTGVVRHSPKANEFLFKHDVIFSEKILGGMGRELELSVGDMLKIVLFVLIGILSLNIKISEIRSILSGLINSGKLTEHYEKFPETPDGFEQWVNEAEILWKKAGKLSDWKPEL
ncbi:MAG: NAD(P)/FAD-dependent oxidoreductase [Clostridia bacterium]|nr:NAD(P)/FAD-dependent oxidoreductase [Clostridia bacterium]